MFDVSLHRISERDCARKRDVRDGREMVARGPALNAETIDKVMQHIAQDQQAFLAQKDQPYGKKTLKAYLWSVCGDEYDAQQG